MQTDLYTVTFQVAGSMTVNTAQYQTKEKADMFRDMFTRDGGWAMVAPQVEPFEERKLEDLISNVRHFLRGLDEGDFTVDYSTSYINNLRDHTSKLAAHLPFQTRYPALIRDVTHFLDGLDRDMFTLSYFSSAIDGMRAAVAPAAKAA